MAANGSRYFEARQIWNWLQWRIPIDLWMEAQRILYDEDPSTPRDPELVAGLAELQNPATTRARKLVLLRQLLTIVKNQS